mgnify:CR=1 FL=1
MIGETWLERDMRLTKQLRDLILAHPEADIAFWTIGQHGEERDAMVQYVEWDGEAVLVTVG